MSIADKQYSGLEDKSYMRSILIIAGSDSCGGAGIQADIKAAYRLGYHPMTVISALTAQNSIGVFDIMPVPREFISKQMNVILDDIMPDAVKIGMLFSIDAIAAVADMLLMYDLSPVVLDPLIQASTGAALLERGGMDRIKEKLFPIVSLITPNRHEAELLLNIKIDTLRELEEAAKALYDMGTMVVITGYCERDKVIDLAYDGRNFFYIEDKAIDIRHGHGSGCVFSTSIAIYLAEGKPLQRAVQLAHEFTKQAIKRGYPLGRGSGPVFP